MKKIVVLVACCALLSCGENHSALQQMQSEINNLNNQNDSLKKLVSIMKPGLGELMLGIQTHHVKLWYAGREENWPLAQFEHDEIVEILKQAETVETDRPEVKLFKQQIYPLLDTVQKAITAKSYEQFSESFYSLTRSCNACHHATHYEFNRIQTPDHNPYSDQDFSTGENN